MIDSSLAVLGDYLASQMVFRGLRAAPVAFSGLGTGDCGTRIAHHAKHVLNLNSGLLHQPLTSNFYLIDIPPLFMNEIKRYTLCIDFKCVPFY